MSKETSDEPYWMPQLRKILDETKKHHKEASDAFYHLKKQLKKTQNEEVKDRIDIVDTFVEFFPYGGATVHDLLMFLEEHVLLFPQ